MQCYATVICPLTCWTMWWQHCVVWWMYPSIVNRAGRWVLGLYYRFMFTRAWK